MSGFVGFISPKTKNQKQIIKKMNNRIKHRGPDGEEYYVDKNIAIGACQLHINNDKSPLLNEDKTLVLALAGRIYNYQELKKELEEKNHKFKTKYDGEVVLHGYEEYKEGIFSKLRGMFAFVLYDIKKETLIGVRDAFGAKPFYYYQNSNNLFVASEIKAFLEHPEFKKELNKDALKPYLSFQYSVLDETFFKNVYRLNPGEYFVYKNEVLEKHKYFEIIPSRHRRDYENIKKELTDILNNSVETYKRTSNVEIGAYLSGGVDSSYVVSAARTKKTFTVGFEHKGFDETKLAKDLSEILKLKNYSKHIDGDEFFNALPEVQYHTDEPHANLSAVPLYFLSKLTSKEVKVVLSGEGSDEMFCGYNEYNPQGLDKIYLKVPFSLRKIIGRCVRFFPKFKGKKTLIYHSKKLEDTYLGVASIMTNEEASKILLKDYDNNLTPAKILKPYYDKVKGLEDTAKKNFIDLHFWLPKDMLLKADKMSMAHSIELRTPILDKEVYNLASTISTSELIKNGQTKYIFRDISHDIIPEEWAKRPKVGIPVPFAIWLREEKYYLKVKETFNEKFTSEIFNVKELNKLLDDHYNLKQSNGRKIYVIYVFLIWYKKYFLEQ